ncbi:EMB2654 [Symbiodinium natans]|uniref:EMB2654 protein n=1 Tax=Symbiodinium natans TaxID=878477 RepID=A0A812KSV4_9DINO|nr:EMB2654 [Symbiodinium natans]
MSCVPRGSIPNGRSRAVLQQSTKVIASDARQSHWQAALATLWSIADKDVEADSILYCAALGALERAIRWETALGVVQSMLCRAVDLYDHGLNYVALTCKKSGQWQRLLRLLVSSFRGVEHPAHEVAFTAGLDACRARWAQGLGLWRCLAHLRAEADATALSAVVAGLRQAAEWQHAVGLMQECFRFGPEPDAALCNAVATACEARQEWEQALEVLRKMLSSEVEPDIITFSAIISACEADEQWAFALAILTEMQKHLITSNVITNNAAIAACAAAGQWVQATALLRAMCNPDAVSFNAAIAACEADARWQIAVFLLQDMKLKRLLPDALTHNAAQRALKAAWQWQRSLDLLADMKSDICNGGMMPDLITYSAALSVCEKVLAKDQAVALLEEVDMLVSGDWPWLMCTAVQKARLQHVQGTAFGLLEEMPCLTDSYLEALFLCQMCVIFLDPGQVSLDSNRLALAVRSLCVLVVFCRRTLLHQLLKLSGEPTACLEASRHLQSFLGESMPRLFEVLADLACGKGRCQTVRRCGLWKLALEALFYLVEDSLAAIGRFDLDSDASNSYWSALTTSFSRVLSGALQSPRRSTQPVPTRSSKCDHNRSEANMADVSVLSQVLGNLLMQRILPCSKTPATAAESAVHLLQVLVSQQGMGSSSLRHFFALCAMQPEVPEVGNPTDEEELKLSVITATAKGATTVSSVRQIPCRPALLGIAVPALVAHVRALFARYLQDEEARQRGAPMADAAAQKAIEVRQALMLLQKMQVDEAAVAAATTGASLKARSACSLAGSRGLVMALLPQLASLASVGAPDVRRAVREVLEALASELEL